MREYDLDWRALSVGAQQLRNITDTLFSCHSDILTACRPSDLPQLNLTFMSECDQLVDKFKAGAQECLDKNLGASRTNTADACSCWTNPSLNDIVQNVKMCKESVNQLDLLIGQINSINNKARRVPTVAKERFKRF